MIGGTRIFVLHKKDLIKIGAAVAAGLVLIILALVLIFGGSADEATPGAGIFNSYSRFVPGTYVSTILLNEKPVDINVIVSEDEIIDIYMSAMADVQRVFYPLLEPRMNDLAQEIIRYQSAFIIPSTDYPVTTGILQQAVQAAIASAER